MEFMVNIPNELIDNLIEEEINRRYKQLNLHIPGLDDKEGQENRHSKVMPVSAITVKPVISESNKPNEAEYTNSPVSITDASGNEVSLPDFVVKVDGKTWYLRHSCGHVEDREIKYKKNVNNMISSAKKFASRKCSQCRIKENNALDLRDGYALINAENPKQACWASENRRDILNNKIPLLMDTTRKFIKMEIESGELKDTENALNDFEESMAMVISCIKNEENPDVFIHLYNSSKGDLGGIINHYENKIQA